jgi:hypothetical protein
MGSAPKLTQNQNGFLIKIEESGGRKNFVKLFTIFHSTTGMLPRARGRLRPNCEKSPWGDNPVAPINAP